MYAFIHCLYVRFTQNDFLGHVELSTRQLQTLTASSNGQALMLPLSNKETHGTLRVKLGFTLPPPLPPQDEAKRAAGAAGQDGEEEAALYVQLLDAENLVPTYLPTALPLPPPYQ